MRTGASPDAASALARDDHRACRLAFAPRLLLRKAITPAPTGCVTALATMQSRRPARSGCDAGVSRPPVLSCPYGRSCSASGTRIGGIATLRFFGTSYEGQGLANRREVKSSEVLRCRTTTEWFQPKAPLDLAAPRLSRPSGNLGTRPTSRRPNALYGGRSSLHQSRPRGGASKTPEAATACDGAERGKSARSSQASDT
jgi:hypothetical protein